MKRAGLFLALFVMALIFASAVADVNVPYNIITFLNQRYSYYDIMGFVNPVNNNDAFVTIDHDGQNKLVAFRYENGNWNYRWARAEPLPQDGDISLFDVSSQYYNGIRFGTAFSIRQSNYGGGYETVWEKSGTKWYLRGVFYYNGNSVLPQDSFYVESNGIRYQGEESGYSNVYVQGTVQTDLQYFVFSTFPKDVSTMRRKINPAPEIPYGTLNPQNIKFPGGQKYDVYSGPGEWYVRGANGRAMVSTNDWIQVFGQENDWILIQYSITSDHMRFGYIPAISLPRNAYVAPFNFNAVSAVTNRYVELTDDPLFSQSALYSLSAGTRVSWLSVMGNWAYVEYREGVYVRGFVPMDALTTGQ
ncbi:MAG: hypothetical protein IJ088_08020 [Clostridia bacterium]|nr:hypothetical protein [Clostridia bacterium]